MTYEFEEKIEGQPGEGILKSRNIDSYLYEYCAHLSFASNSFCSPDRIEVERLTSGQLSFSIHYPPSHYIREFFDTDRTLDDRGAELITCHFDKAIALHRKTYVAVTKSINTFISGLQRTFDSLETAYSLIVASLESLAAFHFQMKPTIWEDYNSENRKKFEAALQGAEEETIQAVKDVILGIEHTSLSRKFIEFVKEHIDDSFFREEASPIHPIQKTDLSDLLKQAYNIRSGYLHQLEEIPRLISYGNASGDFCIIRKKPIPTLYGIAKLARHVINNFVDRQPKITHEPHDYTLEQVNVLEIDLSPEYWIGKTETLRSLPSLKRLEGVSSHIAEKAWNDNREPTIDLRPLAAKFFSEKRTLKKDDIRNHLTSFVFYNAWIDEEYEIPNLDPLLQEYKDLFDNTLPNNLILSLINAIQWTAEEYSRCMDYYFSQRNNKTGIRLHSKLELIIILRLAEEHRKKEDHVNLERLIKLAIETHPGRAALLELEKTLDTRIPLDLTNLLKD